MSSGITTYSMILGSILSKRWADKGFTQQKFFQKTGISTGTWSRLMRGKAHFQMEDLRAACSVLELDVSEITQEADAAEKKLKEEDIDVASQEDVKKNPSIMPLLVAGGVLAFLIFKSGR